ncbi:S-methyl-5'-thioinosine phosphorylase [Gammaproteobacteria bacterium]|nr:S-methyl-5'-thioinosine phosphorylase [Gammaproteobacteria bacterium]
MSIVPSTAIIGGSGLYGLSSSDSPPAYKEVKTPYSSKPIELALEKVDQEQVWFIPRHGKEHSIPPHLINYRANLWALKEANVKNIIAVNAVGGITAKMAPGQIVIPDQILDYTWGREHTYFDGLNSLHNHIDFTWPYDKSLNQIVTTAARHLNLSIINSGVYACTQGPRLETAAEIIKLHSDGADVVGMTGMPEAALARELGIAYTSLALVVNWGAGLSDEALSIAEIKKVLAEGLSDVRKIIFASLPELNALP